MRNNHILNNGIPISISLNPVLEQEHFQAKKPYDKKRIFTISALAVSIAVCVSFVAKLLVYLIDLVTNISFYGNFSIEPSSPAIGDQSITRQLTSPCSHYYCRNDTKNKF